MFGTMIQVLMQMFIFISQILMFGKTKRTQRAIVWNDGSLPDLTKPLAVEHSDDEIWKNRSTLWNISLEAERQLLRAIKNGFVLPFLTGSPLISDIPHVNANSIIGNVNLTQALAKQLTLAAQQSPYNLASFWLGGVPYFYITSNTTRRKIIKEGLVGTGDENDADILEKVTFNNQVMCNFPAFMPRNDTYKKQRKFLLHFFHIMAKERLPTILKAANQFFIEYEEKFAENPQTIRDFSMALILRTSSHLFGLTQTPMDTDYYTNPEYKKLMDEVVSYGISSRGNVAYEKKLYIIFEYLLRRNYPQIKEIPKDKNILSLIFESYGESMPETFEQFESWDNIKLKHKIAMNYMAIVPGGKIHSTGNTLDWAIATLLNDSERLVLLTEHAQKHQDADLTMVKNYDYGGPFFHFFKLVAETLIKNPPFSHQFFYNPQPLTVEFEKPARSIVFPGGSFFLPNYVACNRSEKLFRTPEGIEHFLAEVKTVSGFRNDNRIASFGGSDLTGGNTVTRRCPAAVTSILEMSAILVTLVMNNGTQLRVKDQNRLTLDIDPKQYPIQARKNNGHIFWKRIEKAQEPVQDCQRLKQ